MKLTVIPIVVGSLGTVTKGFERRLQELKLEEGRIETILMIVLLRSTRILRKVLDTFRRLWPSQLRLQNTPTAEE